MHELVAQLERYIEGAAAGEGHLPQFFEDSMGCCAVRVRTHKTAADQRPLLQVFYGHDQHAEVALDDGSVLSTDMSGNVLTALLAWLRDCHDPLMAAWESLPVSTAPCDYVSTP